MRKNISRAICLVTAMCCLGGCQNAAEQAPVAGQVGSDSKENTITYQLLEEAQLDYEVPEMIPGLCVPSGGYDVSEDKVAYAYGKLLPKEFYLVEKASGERVYTGELSGVTYHKDTQTYSAVADFSGYTEKGEYVLQCDYLGYSYPFPIEENLQEKELEGLVELFPEQVAVCEDIQNNVDASLLMLLSYEFYGQVYETIEGEIPSVLSAVNKYVEVLVKEMEGDASDFQYNPYMMAALLAKHGYTYQKFDETAGNEAVKLAKKLWRDAEKDKEISSTYRILAAAELYRVTGTYSYRKLVQDYFTEQLENGTTLGNQYDVLAALTHFKTDYKVKRALCTDLMDKLLDKTEGIAAYISLDNQLLERSKREGKLTEIMWNMVYVSVVEYVITNYEYGDLLENQYFYLQGRNPQACDYVNEFILENPTMQAGYVLMLCEHLAHDHLK